MKQLTKKQTAIKNALKQSRYTLTDIAIESGYSHTTIQKWTYGDHEPREASYTAVMDAIVKLDGFGVAA